MTNSKHLNANQNIFKSTKLSVLDNLVHCVTKIWGHIFVIYSPHIFVTQWTRLSRTESFVDLNIFWFAFKCLLFVIRYPTVMDNIHLEDKSTSQSHVLTADYISHSGSNGQPGIGRSNIAEDKSRFRNVLLNIINIKSDFFTMGWGVWPDIKNYFFHATPVNVIQNDNPMHFLSHNSHKRHR